MATATKVPSVPLLAPPVKLAGRVASAPLKPLLAPAVFEPAEGGAVLKLAVALPALYGGVAMVGTALEWLARDVVGFGDNSVAGDADDCGGVDADRPLPPALNPAKGEPAGGISPEG